MNIYMQGLKTKKYLHKTTNPPLSPQSLKSSNPSNRLKFNPYLILAIIGRVVSILLGFVEWELGNIGRYSS